MRKMNIKFSPPDLGDLEIENVIEVIKSGWITTGSKTKLFEQKITELCNTERTVCLNSATAALELTLRILGIGPGDEVITTAYTYTASCSVICHVGAKPVLVDIQKDHFEMDYEKLEDLITEKTKAIIPVDIAGIMCDYDRIQEIVNKKVNIFNANNNIQKQLGRIAIIADSAHGFGAKRKNKMSGEYADFTCFSFHAVKNLTTAEGGAVTWRKNKIFDNEDIYKRFQILSLHGQTKDAYTKNKLGSWEYDIIEPAYKCNMTDIMAAIGLAQLERYPSLLKRRSEIIKKYEEKLKEYKVKLLEHENLNDNTKSSGHLFLVRINNFSENDRNNVIEKMAERGIATNVHYKPLPMFTAYKNLGFDIKDFPNSYEFYKNEITLPLYSLLTDEEVNYIIDNFVEVLGEIDEKV